MLVGEIVLRFQGYNNLRVIFAKKWDWEEFWHWITVRKERA